MVRRAMLREYAMIRGTKYDPEGKRLLTDEELLGLDDLQPQFSGVNSELFEIYKYLIKFDDSGNFSR